MDDGSVAGIPQEYQLSANAAAALAGIRESESGQQISILLSCVVDMGYDPAKMENMVKVAEPLVSRTAEAERTSVSIEGVDNATVVNYMNLLNANDFDRLVELFLPDGGAPFSLHSRNRSLGKRRFSHSFERTVKTSI